MSAWEDVLRVAGLLHFSQVPAMLMLPRVLDWQTELASLSVMNQRLIRVVVAGIMLCVLGLGAIVIAYPAQMLSTRLGWALSLFLALFWACRAAAQFLVYARVWPQGQRWAHFCLCALFPLLSLLYTLGMIVGGGQ